MFQNLHSVLLYSSHIHDDSTVSSIATILKPEGKNDRVGARCLIDRVGEFQLAAIVMVGLNSCHFNPTHSSQCFSRCPVLCRTNSIRMEKETL